MHIQRHLRRTVSSLALIVFVSLTQGCATEGLVEPPAELVGSWNATSITANGVDLMTQGMTLVITFSADNEYSFNITGDLLGFCDSSDVCSDFGDYTISSGRVVFDPGTPDELSVTYTVRGSSLDLAGTADGVPFSGTFDRF